MAPRRPAQTYQHAVENASPTALAPGEPGPTSTHLLRTAILIKPLRKALQRIRGPTFGSSNEHRERHRNWTSVVANDMPDGKRDGDYASGSSSARFQL